MNRKRLVIYCLLHVMLGISLFLFSAFGNVETDIIFGFFYLLTLLFYVLVSINSENKATIILASSYLVYFYQVPFMGNYLIESPINQYIVQLDGATKLELYQLYYFISLFFILPFLATLRINLNFQEIKVNKLFVNCIFIVSTIISLILVVYLFINSGGLNQYLLLNKFEQSSVSKMGFFSYKNFSLIAIASGLLSNSKKSSLVSYCIAIMVILLEILSAKRFMVLAVIILIYMTKNIKFKINVKSILLAVSLYLGMNMLKQIYYPLKNFMLGNGEFKDIFNFVFMDFITENLFIGEGNSHIRLAALIEKNGINFPDYSFIQQLIASLPFSSIYSSYETAGEHVRLALGVEWAGLASSLYIVPFVNYHIFGLLVIFILYSGIILVFVRLLKSKKSLFLILLFLVNSPQLLFYIQREEIILITKNLTLSFVTLLFVYFIAFYFYSVFKSKISNTSIKIPIEKNRTGRVY